MTIKKPRNFQVIAFSGGSSGGGGGSSNITFDPNPLDIGDSDEGLVSIINNSTTKSACLTNISISGPYSVTETELILGPDSSQMVNVTVVSIGEQTGQLTADSSDGPLSLDILSNLSYLPSSIDGYVADYDVQSLVEVPDNTTITELTDRSPNKYHSTGVTGTVKYRSGANGINNYPAIRFDSVAGGNKFTLPSELRTALASAGEAEYFAVIVGTTSDSGEPLGIGNAATGGLYPLGGPYPQGLYSGFCAASTVNPGNTTLALTSAHILSVAHSGTHLIMRQNGNNVGSTASNTFNAGASICQLPATYANSIPFKGKIGQVIVYDRVLTGKERDDLIAFLKSRWGIP